MDYEITTYEDGYIEKQFEIGSKIYDPWPMGGQTRPDQLRITYEAEDFDPETRFYAFHNGEMIGFLTTSFKEKKDGKNYYYFEFPYVLEEHRPQAERDLIEYAIRSLKSKGADILVARAGEYWGNSLFYANEYDFVKTRDIARRGEIDIETSEVESYGDPSNLVDYQPDDHLDQLAKLYADQFGSDVESMKQQLKRWNKLKVGDSFTSPWDHLLTLLSHKILQKGDEVVGRVVIMQHSNFDDDSINLSQMLLKEPNAADVGDILAHLVEVGNQNKKKTAIIHTGEWGSLEDDDLYSQYNVSFEVKLAYFEKEL